MSNPPSFAMRRVTATSGLLAVMLFIVPRNSPLSLSVVLAYNMVNIPNRETRHAQYASLREMKPGNQQHDENPPPDPPLWATWKNIEATRRRQQEEQQRSQQKPFIPPEATSLPPPPPPPPLPVSQKPNYQQEQPSWERNDPRPSPDRRILAMGTLPDREYSRYRTAPDKDISNIFRQNQEWKHSKLRQDPFFFNKLGSTHKPRYMWIGTS
jgi:type IV secretory pathway VirB10-like protein